MAAFLAPHRGRMHTVICILAAVLAIAAALLLWRGRLGADAARRMVNGESILVTSVAEARALVVQLRLHTAYAVLRPADPVPSTRFRSDHGQLSEELRRARLHAIDPNTVDIIDDLDNRALAYAGAADQLFGALTAGRVEQARAALAALDQDSTVLHELADELTTAATSALDQRARVAAGAAPWPLAVVIAVLAAMLAPLAGVLAWVERSAASNQAATDAIDDAPVAVSSADNALPEVTELDRGDPFEEPAIFSAADVVILENAPARRARDDEDGVFAGVAAEALPEGATVTAPATSGDNGADEGDEQPQQLWRPKSKRPPVAESAA